MKKLLILVLILLTGCSNSELDEVVQKVEDLEMTIEQLENENLDLKAKLEITLNENMSLNESLSEVNKSIEELPYYVRRCFGENSLGCMVTQTPDNSYLLFETMKRVAGYKIYEYEYGPCLAHGILPLYSTEEYNYTYSIQAGCNPEWINSEPFYVLINDSLFSISDAVDLGFISVEDLEDSYLFEKREK